MNLYYPLLRTLVTVGLLAGVTALAGAQSSTTSSATPPESKPAAKATLNEGIVRFCRERLGKKVGDGECTSLAQEALRSVGADNRFKDSPANGDYVWGAFVCKLEFKNGEQTLEVGEAGKSTDKRRRTDVRAGDIIQYRDVKFEGKMGRILYSRTYTHHTAVIGQISEDGLTCKIYESNVDGKRYVMETTLYLPHLTSGWLRVYRPIEKGTEKKP